MSTSIDKLHFIFLYLWILSIKVAPKIETVFSYLKYTWEIFCKSNECLGIHYIINVYPEVKQWKVTPSKQRNNAGFFDRLVHHYHIDILAFCALITQIFKTDLQKDKISCVKEFISAHM